MLCFLYIFSLCNLVDFILVCEAKSAPLLKLQSLCFEAKLLSRNHVSIVCDFMILEVLTKNLHKSNALYSHTCLNPGS